MKLIEKYKLYKSIEKHVMENPTALEYKTKPVLNWTWRGISQFVNYNVLQNGATLAQACCEVRRRGNHVYCLYTMNPNKEYHGRFAKRVYEMLEEKYNTQQR